MPQEPTLRQVVLLLFPVASVIVLGCGVADDLKPWDAPPFPEGEVVVVVKLPSVEGRAGVVVVKLPPLHTGRGKVKL
jgi:hypothetical protein